MASHANFGPGPVQPWHGGVVFGQQGPGARFACGMRGTASGKQRLASPRPALSDPGEPQVAIEAGLAGYTVSTADAVAPSCGMTSSATKEPAIWRVLYVPVG